MPPILCVLNLAKLRSLIGVLCVLAIAGCAHESGVEKPSDHNSGLDLPAEQWWAPQLSSRRCVPVSSLEYASTAFGIRAGARPASVRALEPGTRRLSVRLEDLPEDARRTAVLDGTGRYEITLANSEALCGAQAAWIWRRLGALDEERNRIAAQNRRAQADRAAQQELERRHPFESSVDPNLSRERMLAGTQWYAPADMGRECFPSRPPAEHLAFVIRHNANPRLIGGAVSLQGYVRGPFELGDAQGNRAGQYAILALQGPNATAIQNIMMTTNFQICNAEMARRRLGLPATLR